MGSGQRVPFQRAVSVDGKPLSGPGMTGRRSAPSSLVKQEHTDTQIGMGECLIYSALNVCCYNCTCFHFLVEF